MHTQPKFSRKDPFFLVYENMLSRVSDPIANPDPGRPKLSPKQKKEQYRNFMFEEVVRFIQM
jgi:hypothetical protein